MTHEPNPPSSGTVLLVDDEVPLLLAYQRYLTKAGFQVTACRDGAEAIQALETHPFDVVVSDITMPNLDGITLLREVRRCDLDVPVILITGAPSVETAIESVNLGALEYLVKPIQRDDLVHTTTRAVHLHRLTRAKHDALDLLGTWRGRAPNGVGLGEALERAIHGLWPAFQPIVSSNQGALFGYEALMRTEEISLASPVLMLDVAERLGKLELLGRTMRERCCHFWATSAPPPLLLFLNLHPQDLLDSALLDPGSMLHDLARHIVLEVTERNTLEKVPHVEERVAALRSAGYRIAVDDLGAGYAGLNSFIRLEPEFVKLDMSLVRDVDQNPLKQRLVRSMTMVSKDLGSLVVAEGVETLAERDTLIDLGCDLLQGYRFGRPMRSLDTPTW